MSEQSLHSAAAIARTSGLSPQAVYAGLSSVGPAGEVMAFGKMVKVWDFNSLPIEWQMTITRRGVKRGFQNGEAYLKALTNEWQPPVPTTQIASYFLDRAKRL